MAYTVRDLRGSNKPAETSPCRTCGCPEEEHTREYNNPTMGCIRYLRGVIEMLSSKNALLRAKIPDNYEKKDE